MKKDVFYIENIFQIYFLPILDKPFIASKASTGNAKITVLDWSLLKSFNVANVLKCKAPGVLPITAAAFAKFSEASTSPSDFVITACFSLSASATRDITLFNSYWFIK